MPDNSNDNLDDLDRGATRPRDDRHGRDTLDSAAAIKGETVLAGRYCSQPPYQNWTLTFCHAIHIRSRPTRWPCQ